MPLTSRPETPAFSVTRTIETAANELARGNLFAGRYEIIEELGAGGMGHVYRAYDQKIEEEVALKLIRPDIAAEKRTVERFRNEIKTTRKIRHANVCGMHDLHEEGKTLFITMEYVRGEDLKSVIRRMKILTPGTAVSIARQIAEGLGEAHRLGVVHRDLKPSNIMIDKDGNAKIMDFGIARSLAGAGTTAEGATIGTPEYMSPEQVEAKPADERADIYAIGVILFEMVTGRPPFEGDTSLAIAHKHRYNPAPDPRTLNPQIFQDLSRLILRCLEKEREARYQTTEELLTDLKAVEASLPKGERVPGRMPSGIKFKTSREITVKLTPRKLLIPALVFLALFAIIIGLLKFIPKKETSLPPASKPSVAVLAFADLSPDKSNEYLADGISDALINALSKIRNLRVPGRTSTFSFKGQKTDVREIGQKLNVKMVLEGSVQVVGDRLRVAAQLINAEDGFQLWSDRYERKMEDIFAIQDEIGRAIVDTMKIEILGDKSTASSKSSTLNLEAYSLYLKGLYLWNKRGKEDLEKSIDFFQAAIDRDRSYALAYSGLADAYSTLGGNYFMPSREAFSKSKVAAFKAIELDGTLAEAHSSLANALFHERDFSRAEREHRLAIQLKPGYATAHHWYAFVLSCSGRHKEAIDEILLARELDPLSPRINANVGHMLCFARKYDQALEELKKGIVLFPEHASNYALMGLALSQLGRFEEAIESYRRSNELSGKEGYSSIGSLEHCYAVSGHENEARNGLAQILDYSKHHFVSPVFIASIFVGLGDKDKALAWLEEGFSQSDAQLVYLKVNPIFDPLRSDPRFAAFLKKAHLR